MLHVRVSNSIQNISCNLTDNQHQFYGVCFLDGLAPVKIEGKWGYINKLDLLVIPPKFDEAWGFSEGIACVKVGDKYGYIDKMGKYVLPLQYNAARSFSKGIAQIEIDGNKRYIDKRGRLAISRK